MNYSSREIVFQEVPGEISICFTITGCKIQCAGCHSPYLWKASIGKPLSKSVYKESLNKYLGFATCVLFMGGEWHKEELIMHLKYAKELGYKTCLYTGENKVDAEIKYQLTWIKTGNWDSQLGGLSSRKTNQKFRETESDKLLNHLFQINN